MTAPLLRGAVTPASPQTIASELLVLLPSLGTTASVWDGVVGRLTERLPGVRILRVDLPGHGVSPPVREPFTIADLATATLRVVDDVGGGRFHVAGLSLGGAIALELAASHPERVVTFTAFCSGSAIGTPEGWAVRAEEVRASGTASLVSGSAMRWFTPDYLSTNPDGPAARTLGALLDVDDESYALCCEALAGFDRGPSLPGIAVPALIVAGEHDPVTTPASMRPYVRALPDGQCAEIPDSAHLAPLQKPDESAELLVRFLGDSDAARSDARAAGMLVRRAVLGDAHVDAATDRITPETADFQDFITRYAWGEIWAREQLTRRERSIATLASLVTGGHHDEIAMHVRAAERNGLTRTEIAEVILHTALYAGLPAANTALAIARDVFASTERADTAGGDRHG